MTYLEIKNYIFYLIWSITTSQLNEIDLFQETNKYNLLRLKHKFLSTGLEVKQDMSMILVCERIANFNLTCKLKHTWN